MLEATILEDTVFENFNYLPPPSPEERILEVLKQFKPSKYQYLSEKEIRNIIVMIVYNTRVGSLSHYEHYIKDRIIKESLHTLDYYNFKHKLRYKHAELQMAKFAKIWLERYYSYGGQGYLKLQKRWNREIISK
tara:strand:- start:21174 stop:21575 length:402 start_codon:yes stop_codon:yes gene_type:complete